MLFCEVVEPMRPEAWVVEVCYRDWALKVLPTCGFSLPPSLLSCEEQLPPMPVAVASHSRLHDFPTGLVNCSL